MVVEGAGQLPGQALEAQVVVEGEVEGDGVGAVLGQGQLLVLGGPNLEVVGPELDGLAVDVDRIVAGLVQGAADLGAVGSGQGRLDRRQPGPSRGPSARKLGTTE